MVRYSSVYKFRCLNFSLDLPLCPSVSAEQRQVFSVSKKKVASRPVRPWVGCEKEEKRRDIL